MSNCMGDQKKSKLIYYLNEGSLKDKGILYIYNRIIPIYINMINITLIIILIRI